LQPITPLKRDLKKQTQFHAVLLTNIVNLIADSVKDCSSYTSISLLPSRHTFLTNLRHSQHLRFMIRYTLRNESQDSAIGIAPGYGLDDRRAGVRVLAEPASRSVLGSTQPPIQGVPEVLSEKVIQPGCQVDHSHPTSAEVKKTCASTHPLLHTPSWRSA
jgi:hypothetical protein